MKDTPQSDKAKWFAHISDVRIPAPQRRVAVKVLKAQTNVPDSHVLVRDHNSPNDAVFNDDDIVDLAEGNVFYSVARCDLQPRDNCTDPPKLAFSVNDRVELTLKGDQTGRTLRDWFGIPCNSDLIRDLETPADLAIDDAAAAAFIDGPVFYTRAAKAITIVVNGREKEVQAKEISYAELVRLAFNGVDPDFLYTVAYKKGPAHKPEGTMVDGDSVKLNCGMIFNVSATRKS